MVKRRDTSKVERKLVAMWKQRPLIWILRAPIITLALVQPRCGDLSDWIFHARAAFGIGRVRFLRASLALV